MIASASNAIASAASPCLKFILQLAAAGGLKVAEASFNQWMIAFGLTVATAVVPKMDRRRNNKLNILQGLMVLGAAYMYPDVLFMWIGLSSALSAIRKSIRRHFFSAIKRFGNVVRPFQNAALSIQLMILQPLFLFLSASFVLGCSVRLPGALQNMAFLLGLVLVVGIVYSFYYQFCRFRESMADCWTVIILSMLGCIWSTLLGLCMTPVYFIESVAGLVCTTALSFVKALAAEGLAARNDECYNDECYNDESGWWSDSSNDSDYVYDPCSDDEDSIFETKDCSVWIRGNRLHKLERIDYRRFYIAAGRSRNY